MCIMMLSSNSIFEIFHLFLPDTHQQYQQVNPGFMFDQEERRKLKLIQLRRQGKGPPKKGAGARSKSKKKK